MNILIVDDFATMRKIIKNLLLELGFENTDEARDGASALSMLRKGQYDILITDWNMPQMDGLGLLRAVRADDGLNSLPVLLVTAEAKREQIVAAAHSGINGYIVKPFTASTLKEKLHRIFDRIEKAA